MPNPWRGRVVFVTGATGLLGGWLVEGLVAQGASVVCLVRDEVPASRFVQESMAGQCNIVRGDLSDPYLLERVLGEYEVQTVFHLAAQTIVGIANRNPLSTFESNIRGTWNLLEAARRSPLVKQIVVASSDKAYGDQPVLPYQESAPLEGRHPYDVSKSCADLICQSYAKSFDLPVCVTRCGNLYGGGDLNFNRLIPGTIRSILEGQVPVIRSDGQFIRDYFYVEDAVGAYLALAEHMIAHPGHQSPAYNFSSDKPFTALEVVDTVLQVMGSSLKPLVMNQANNEIREQRLDSGLAHSELGWSSTWSLSDGLAKTIEWYRKNFSASLDTAA